MNNLISIVAAFYAGWGLGILASLFVLLFGVIMPRSSALYRFAISVPMVISTLTCFGIAVIALYGEDEIILGLDAVILLTINSGAQFASYWMFVGYAVYLYYWGPKNNQ